MKNPTKPLKKLLDSIRNIEGFPIGKDEDILALSDPPYYTACPNPYINDFIEEHGKPLRRAQGNAYDEATDDYHREPFVGDVSEGKNDPIYNAHSYHTKVPHKAIMKYIEHYTEEGDIVFDGFCGTGMTGVAAQLLNRKAILSDLSPIATFIAYNYNKKVDVAEFEREANRILQEVEDECGWMYETNHVPAVISRSEATRNLSTEQEKMPPPNALGQNDKMDNNKTVEGVQMNAFGKDEKIGKGKINYTVWSDVFICPYCGEEIVFWEVAVDKEAGSVKKEFACSQCNATITKRDCQRATVTFFDAAIGQEVTQTKQVPVLIKYTYNGKRYEKTPDADDVALIKKIEESEIPYWFPTNPMMNQGERWGDTWRKGYHFGITHVHHFYTKRNLWVFSKLFKEGEKIKFILTSFSDRHIVLRNRFLLTGPTRPLSGTLYIPTLKTEVNVINIFKRKINDIIKSYNSYYVKENLVIISTNSLTKTSIKKNSIDYIFIDPPFGENIMYSELNFVNESWLKVCTNNTKEAIINDTQKKDIDEYGILMINSLKECYRILKPNRWITIEFHNTSNKIWNLIQNCVTKAGFVISNVSILDKKHGGIQPVGANYANKDLVISAYKPKQSFERRFLEQTGAGLEEEFIRMHLSHLPAEPSIERTEQMLYSKLLAYYVQRGYAVKYDAKTFYKMLHHHFKEEDGYWFNADQLAAYREYKKKLKLEGLADVKQGQLSLFVCDEKSALQWLYVFLDRGKDLKTTHPAFTKVSNISGDQVPDLKELLEDNFIREGDAYRRPKSEEEKTSIIQKREKDLLREFESLLLQAKASQKKIKECRKQAVLFGFEHCYKNNRFQDILTLAKRLDKRIIENDAEINDFIEVAELKVEGF